MTAVEHYNAALLEAKTKALAKLLAKLDGINDPKLLLAVLRLRPLPTPTAKRTAPPEPAPAASAPSAPPPAPRAFTNTNPDPALIAVPLPPPEPVAPAPHLTRQQRRHLAREAAKRQRRALLNASAHGAPALRG